MFRTLAILCSYCNRAGLTWVGQIRLAKDMGVSQQAIGKQLLKLQKAGYVEVVRKSFRAERATTLRVIFDPSVTAEDAIAMTSNKEDTRPPAIREEQERQAAQQIDREGQARIAKLISQALKQPTKKEYSMPAKGQTRTVQKMQEEIAKAKGKRSQTVEKTVNKSPPFTTPEVVHEEPLHSQPESPPFTTSFTTSEVVRTPEEHIKRVFKEGLYTRLLDCLNNQEVEELISKGLTTERIADSLDILLPLYAAEGIKPTSAILMAGVIQLQADAR
jgi:predicted transcriptional regulator